MKDMIYREDAINALGEDPGFKIKIFKTYKEGRSDQWFDDMAKISALPTVEQEITENLYMCKCYITDKDGLQHEVIHTGDIRRVTGWEI